MILDHIVKHGHITVLPTYSMVRYWWAKLNAEIFDGILLKAQISVGSDPHTGFSADEVDGGCFPLGGERVRIHVSEKDMSKQMLIATIAHEMVHQLQYQHGIPMTHGDFFQQWAVKVKTTTGITI